MARSTISVSIRLERLGRFITGLSFRARSTLWRESVRFIGLLVDFRGVLVVFRAFTARNMRVLRVTRQALFSTFFHGDKTPIAFLLALSLFLCA